MVLEKLGFFMRPHLYPDYGGNVWLQPNAVRRGGRRLDRGCVCCIFGGNGRDDCDFLSGEEGKRDNAGVWPGAGRAGGAGCIVPETGEFADTVLFEYRYRDGAILFTPNASGQIEIPVLKSVLEKYVKRPPAQGENRCFEFRMKANMEEYRWCICHIRVEYDGADTPVCLIGKLDDITKQKEREEQLLFQSTRDGLTGVYNKTAFEYMMEETLKRGSRGCLYMIDIDNFKDVNDQYGHPAGDKILVKIGELLREIFRDSDLIGRVGGDEFVVYSECGETKTRAMKLLNGTADFTKEGEHRISVSIGIAASTGELDEEYQELFSKADQAMYRAKQEGKNRIAWYEE